MKRFLPIVLCIIIIAALTACGNKEATNMVLSGGYTNINEIPAAKTDIPADYQKASPKSGDTVAILHTNRGDISMRFFPEVAPIAVNNFIALAKADKFNNTIFHRVINNFMIQGGDYTNFNGTGGASVYGREFKLETNPNVHNSAGSVAMANRGPGTNGSQFYINQVDNNYLDGSYTVFGQVYDGMDVVNTICGVQTNMMDKPLNDVVIDSIEITTY